MRVALITGGSGGIGAATARVLAAQGCAVAVQYHQNAAAAHALVEELTARGSRAMAVCANLTDPVQAGRMVDSVLEEYCQLDILVCAAGLAHVGLLGEMTYEDWRRVFAVNMDSVFHCCQASLPHFIHFKRGRIVTVSSMWGQVGASCEVAYSAAKAAVIGFTKALAKELAPSGIAVNCVAPGVIDTPMNAGLTREDLETLALDTPMGRIGTPGEVAAAIAFLASEGAGFITGQVLGVSGGLVI